MDKPAGHLRSDTEPVGYTAHREVRDVLGEVIRLPSGELVGPIAVCEELISSQEHLTEKLESAADVLYELRCEVDEVRSQNEQILQSLPAHSPLVEAHTNHIQNELGRITEQLNEAHKVMADLMDSVGELTDKIADGVTVVVAAGNAHGKGLMRVLETIDAYTEKYIPEPVFA